MNKIIYIIIIIFINGLFACSGDKTTPASTPKKTAAPAEASKTEKIKPVLVQEEKQRPEYKVTGERDPFQPFEVSAPGELTRDNKTDKILDPLQRITLSQVELVGIITGKHNRALVQESSGMGYIINEGTLIGENSGIVTKISLDGVTIKQHFKDYMGRVNTREVVMSLRKEEGEL